MCWCWSEHPYHRPSFKEVIAALDNGVTSHLASAFPITNNDQGVVAACARWTSKSQRLYSASASFSREQSAGTPGYLYPLGYTKMADSIAAHTQCLDVWCAHKEGLKCVSCKAFSCKVEVRICATVSQAASNLKIYIMALLT